MTTPTITRRGALALAGAAALARPALAQDTGLIRFGSIFALAGRARRRRPAPARRGA